MQKLEEIESFYGSILSKAPANIYWKGKGGLYLGCNDRLARIMGLSSKDAIKGMTDFDFDWGVEHAAKSFVEFDQRVMDSKQSLSTEDVFREVDGRLVTVLTTKRPLEDEAGKVIGVLAVSVDITERKNTENRLLGLRKKFLLTEREIECLFYVVRGFNVPMIAEKLFVSKRTVETYIENIKIKTNCYTKTDLLERALYEEWLESMPNDILRTKLRRKLC